MEYLIHFGASFLGTIGFAASFNVPKKSLAYCGITGAIGWTLYILLTNFQFNIILSNLIAAIFVSMISEFFARIDKKPVTCFVIPGILPLVPGYGMYQTMFYLVQDQYSRGMEKGVETLFVAGAIAVGIILVSSMSKIIKTISIQKNNHSF